MKALTLTDYIDKKLKTDSEFAEYYAREQIINNIAEMIVEARKTVHLTQSELAKKIGTSQSVISRIESGNSAFIPSLETLVRIAAALDMKLQLQMRRT
ncbi:MAG: helix-turn-helix transcriptional regulator [Legionellales bacterium]|nr:helix-turn-helix transcriptional regulator [Legionellales bacterium]